MRSLIIALLHIFVEGSHFVMLFLASFTPLSIVCRTGESIEAMAAMRDEAQTECLEKPRSKRGTIIAIAIYKARGRRRSAS